MTLVCCLLAGLVAISVFGFIFWHPRPEAARAHLLETHLRDRFIVTLTTGEAMSGLLGEVDADTVILDDVQALSNGVWSKVDGRLFLPRDRVAYMQRTTRQVPA